MTAQTDLLITDYLARVERAAAGLPPGRRAELLRDLREHIDIERAEFPGESETHIRTVLERLGDPEQIVAAADTGETPRIPPVLPPAAAAPRKRTTAWVVGAAVAAAVLLFCLLGVLLMTMSRSEEGPAPVATVGRP